MPPTKSPLPGRPRPTWGRPSPSYWAALDGVRSLILPGNDDGGALRAARGRPRAPQTLSPDRFPSPVLPGAFQVGLLASPPPQALAGPRAPPSPTNGSFRSCSEPLPRRPGAQAVPLLPQQVPHRTQQVRAKQNQVRGSEGKGQHGGRPARAQGGGPPGRPAAPPGPSPHSGEDRSTKASPLVLLPGGRTLRPPGPRARHTWAPVGILPDSAGFLGLTLTLSGNDVQR